MAHVGGGCEGIKEETGGGARGLGAGLGGWEGSAHSTSPQCCLACHKKCLETLAIQCGHKKLQGRLQLFGQDFSQAARSTSDGVPFIVKKCVCEIERRALRTKVTTPGTARFRPGGRGEGRRAWAKAHCGPHRASTGSTG